MEKKDFALLKNFNINDKDYKGENIWSYPGVLENTDFKSMQTLDEICEVIGCGVVLHCAYEPGGHINNSMHYQKVGTAIDFHFLSTEPFYKQIFTIESVLEKLGISKKCGLGVYPDWKSKGFHLDLRGTLARWGAKYVDGIQKYFSYQEILEYCKKGKK